MSLGVANFIGEGIGVGQGKWEIAIQSDRPVGVSNLLVLAGSYLSNLSALPDTRSDLGGAFPINCADLDGATIFSQTTGNVYLGHFGTDTAQFSITNSSGEFGNSGGNGLLNPLSNFGSSTGDFSAYSLTARNPPYIIKYGRIISYLTKNPAFSGKPGFLDIDNVLACTFS